MADKKEVKKEEVIDLYPEEIPIRSFNDIIEQENVVRLSDITHNLGNITGGTITNVTMTVESGEFNCSITDKQVLFSDSGVVAGDADFIYDKNGGILTSANRGRLIATEYGNLSGEYLLIAATNDSGISITCKNRLAGNENGGQIAINSGDGKGTGDGGDISINGGDGDHGGDIVVAAGNSVYSTDGRGGDIQLFLGDGNDVGAAGILDILVGAKGTSAAAATLNGYVRIKVSDYPRINGATTDEYAAGLRLDPAYQATSAQTLTRHNYIDYQQPALANVTITDACVMRFDAAAGTHKAVDSGSTKTTPGTVDAWVKINVNGTVYYMPAYTSKTS